MNYLITTSVLVVLGAVVAYLFIRESSRENATGTVKNVKEASSSSEKKGANTYQATVSERRDADRLRKVFETPSGKHDSSSKIQNKKSRAQTTQHKHTNQHAQDMLMTPVFMDNSYDDIRRGDRGINGEEGTNRSYNNDRESIHRYDFDSSPTYNNSTSYGGSSSYDSGSSSSYSSSDSSSSSGSFD